MYYYKRVGSGGVDAQSEFSMFYLEEASLFLRVFLMLGVPVVKGLAIRFKGMSKVF